LNLFLNLHRWASNQDENFTTESLLIVLKSLLEKAKPAGLDLLSTLIGKKFNIDINDIPQLEIKTQTNYSHGRPDIEILLRNELHIIIEVKVSSPLEKTQLSRYRKILTDKSASQKHLVLLTRYPPDSMNDFEKADHHVRWFHVGECLKKHTDANTIHCKITKNVTEQFFYFLKERGMASESVSWELTKGIQSWQSLHSMIYEALCNKGATPKSSVGAEWGGWYTDSKATKVWIGITWEKPSLLQCDTNGLRVANAPDDFGTKVVTSEKRDPGGLKWMAQIDLESEDTCFFSRNLVNQKKIVENFVNACLEATKNLPTN